MVDPHHNESGIRDFDYDKDIAAVRRIWREVGWTDDSNGDTQVGTFFKTGHAKVGTIDDVAECSVHTAPGTMRLKQTDLPLCAVTAVTTSRISRGRAFAQRLTALQLMQARQEGAAVAALGMFDQGFYNKVGFGTGAYEHLFSFDPGLLDVSSRVPTPERLSVDDTPAMHAALVARKLSHGGVVLDPVELFRAELGFESGCFGLGYRNSDGELTHFLRMKAKGERGPYQIKFYAYQTTDQLLELLGLLKSLADQVYSVSMAEPHDVQLQSMLLRPMRHMSLTKGGSHRNEIRSLAWWQLRILDLPRCVQALSGCSSELQFNLSLSDCVADSLAGEGVAAADWHGEAGDYTVVLGSESHADAEHTAGLPVLSCSINALSRLLWGVCPASALAVTDDFSAAPALLSALDEAIQLPRPTTGWDF